MVFRNSLAQPQVPADAEMFTRSDFTTWVRAKPSRWLPGRLLPDEERFSCPSCAAPGKAEHGGFEVCGCGLHWVAYGNALYVWRVT